MPNVILPIGPSLPVKPIAKGAMPGKTSGTAFRKVLKSSLKKSVAPGMAGQSAVKPGPATPNKMQRSAVALRRLKKTIVPTILIQGPQAAIITRTSKQAVTQSQRKVLALVKPSVAAKFQRTATGSGIQLAAHAAIKAHGPAIVSKASHSSETTLTVRRTRNGHAVSALAPKETMQASQVLDVHSRVGRKAQRVWISPKPAPTHLTAAIAPLSASAGPNVHVQKVSAQVQTGADLIKVKEVPHTDKAALKGWNVRPVSIRSQVAEDATRWRVSPPGKLRATLELKLSNSPKGWSVEISAHHRETSWLTGAVSNVAPLSQNFARHGWTLSEVSVWSGPSANGGGGQAFSQFSQTNQGSPHPAGTGFGRMPTSPDARGPTATDGIDYTA
ncbi:MAG: hypothetical protein ACYCT0_04520 [Sulfobacillus sp.]